jgi:3-hydroxybutyryl-CoA dehydratase
MSDFGGVTEDVTQAGIDAYAELSGDFNPLHVDPEAAAASEFGGIIAHGPIALQAFFRAATTWLGVDALPPGCEVAVTYRAPTRPGDAVTCELRSLAEAGGGRAEITADCEKQDGTPVVSVRATLAPP